ncbi:TVP38/TMEM64 family protein [Anianabacter salinae]|uniref:TVP38/TMEM64 family protein n=1 Tax=Anianabacter salinae TaxID=2851023 RepID=UPI00225E2E6A|nr:TVP38/TMEM64 family protein [Anianabacter salinae]MBV0911459.1 TVP38/TMEM64 family protein [Anianabacter salinae]
MTLSPRLVTAAAVLALALVVLCGWALAVRIEPEIVMARIEAAGPWAFAVIIVLMILHNVVPVPAEIIAVCAGMALGPWLGILAVWLGAMAGAIIAFWLARKLGRDWVEARLPVKRRAQLARASDRLGAGGLLTARLIPVIAFNLVNYGAGLTRVGWGTFLWTTAVGILPMVALTVFAGASMSAGAAVWALTGAVVLAALWLLWRGLTARRRGPPPSASPARD